MIIIQGFNEDGQLRETKLYKKEGPKRVEIDSYGRIRVLESEVFCKECNGSGGVTYHYDQDNSTSLLCFVCNGGSKERWKAEKDRWALYVC